MKIVFGSSLSSHPAQERRRSQAPLISREGVLEVREATLTQILQLRCWHASCVPGHLASNWRSLSAHCAPGHLAWTGTLFPRQRRGLWAVSPTCRKLGFGCFVTQLGKPGRDPTPTPCVLGG